MNLPSKLIDDAVQAFASLPGIGRKTTLRLVLHLLKQDPEKVHQFSYAIDRMRQEIRFCHRCHNVVDPDTIHTDEQPTCHICRQPSRDKQVVCVVEDLRDLIAIESTQQFNGTYHILGGIISPVDGIGPEDLHIDSLTERVRHDDVKELIMALSPTIEGDTTIFYISRQLAQPDIRITTIARGIAFGGDLEYVDDITLSRSLANRLPYENYLVKK